jgi:hypothetical protein
MAEFVEREVMQIVDDQPIAVPETKPKDKVAIKW